MNFRDGVGDGQIPYVVEHEVAAITNCFQEAGMENVKFTFIIVLILAMRDLQTCINTLYEVDVGLFCASQELLIISCRFIQYTN